MPSAGTSLSTDHRLFGPINGRHVWARLWPASDDSGSTMAPQAREIAMIKVLLATAAFVLVAAAVPSSAQQAAAKDQLIGSWKVLNLKATTGDRVSYPLGEQVAGYVTITP